MPPTFLIDTLNAVRRKVKVLSVMFGVGLVLACAVALLMGTVALDFCFSYLLGVNLPGGMRALLLLAIVVAFAFAAIRWVIKPIMARLSLSELAGHLESVFPEFDDRLRSTVNFVQQPADVPGSDFMKDRVVSQATELVQKTDLSRALVTRPVWLSLGSAVLAVGLLVGVSIMVKPFLSIGLPRLFSPFADTRWPKTVEINAPHLPTRVPVGQRVDISLGLAKGGDRASLKATIFYQYDDGPVQKEYMIRGADGKYNASLDAHGQQLKVWMAAGDDETAPAVIAVVPRLAIQSVAAVINAPDYAKMPPTTIDIAKAPAFMVVGSKVAVHVQFNKPLDANKPVLFEVLENGDKSKPADPGIAIDRANATAPIGTWVARQSFRFRIHATDTDEFENTALEEYEVSVKPDQLPTVMIESPKKTVERSPDAYLPMQVLAEDDFGIDSLRLIVDRIAVAPDPKDANAPAPAGALKHWEIPLKDWARIDGTGERQRFRLNWEWVLKTNLPDVKPGDVLEYYVEVRDNYKLQTTENGKPVLAVHPPQFSSKLRINVLSPDEIAQIVTQEIRAVAEVTKNIRDSQVSNQRETKTLAEETKDKPELSKGDKSQLEGMTSRESAIVSKTTSAAQQLEEIAKQLKENKIPDKELNDITKDAKQQLDQAAQKQMTDAANDLNKAAQSKANPADPQQSQKAKESRNQALKQSDQNQEDAAKKLEAAMSKMSQVGDLAQTIKQVQDLKDAQAKLRKDLEKTTKDTVGKTPDQLTEEQKKELDRIAKEQKELAERMDKLTAQMEKMKEQMAKSDPTTAEAMDKAASQSKSQQIAPKQRQAADDAKQNQQSKAQQNQQGAELGLEVVLQTLKDAENRKLAQLKKMLDDAKAAVADLIKRQAGHNVDDLNLQGDDARAKAITKDDLDALYKKASRQPGVGPKIELGVLTSGQEATERNTRGVAKDVEEKVKNVGGEIAQHLVRAAGKMGYAIVDLRDKKLVTAYSPHQVEALAALEKALKVIDDAKKDVENQENEKQAEVIKARLEKIRAEQAADVNKPTVDLQATRKPDGALPRESGVRAAQLVTKEGDLAKRMTDVANDLQGLGGIIYTDAGKEVAEGMNEVKDDLGKQKTGDTTQLEEARIIEQLDAMIDSLKKDIDQSKFNQKGGGGDGNGSGGKSKFPTEAELKLLKAMQLAVNKNTTKAGELPKEKQDKVALVNLGSRQGKLRTMLDTLLKQATGGKEGLRPEPKDDVKLPEEAGKEAIENKEADDELLGGDPQAAKETKQLNRVGDRMARSRQRLALDTDPGKTTQEIQRRIVVDIDDMIKQSQQQQANNPPKPGEGQPKPDPGEGKAPGQQQANGQGKESKPNNAQEAAKESTVSGGGSRDADLSKQIAETNREWGAISPRLRKAVLEGSTEKVPEKYKKLIEDYYRGIATGGKQP